MRTLTALQFDDLLTDKGIRPRLKQELKFATSTASMPDDWSDFELVAIADKTNAKGVLLLQPYNELYVIPYELSPVKAGSSTGRTGAIICDFCLTWQRGSNAGSITLGDRRVKRIVSFLCCGDLACSRNVRSKTEAARISRTQLRESLDDDGRINRLKLRLEEKIIDLGLRPTQNNNDE